MTIRDAINIINAEKLSLETIKSPKIKHDKTMHIIHLKRKIKRYCKSKNYDFNKLCKEYNL